MDWNESLLSVEYQKSESESERCLLFGAAMKDKWKVSVTTEKRWEGFKEKAKECQLTTFWQIV